MDAPHHPFDLAAARAYLDRARARRVEGRSIQLAITSDGRTALGEILVSVTGPDGPSEGGPYAELAYAVGVRHRRQQLATRAARLVTDYAYRTLAMQQVILHIHPRQRGQHGNGPRLRLLPHRRSADHQRPFRDAADLRHQAPGSHPRPT